MEKLGSLRWAVGFCGVVGFGCDDSGVSDAPGIVTQALGGPACSIESTVRSLPVPPGAVASEALAVNKRGEIAGGVALADDGTDSVAVVWTKHDRLFELPQLAAQAEATAIDKHRVVAGLFLEEGESEWFVWSHDGGVVMLDELGPPEEHTDDVVSAMNDHGSLVGFSETGDSDRGGIRLAVRWGLDGSIVDVIGTAGERSEATGINDRGVVVGYRFSRTNTSAFRWTEEDGMSDIRFPGELVNTAALGINNRGEVFAFIDTVLGPQSYGILRTDGSFDALPIPAGYVEITPFALNDSGWVLGQARLENGPTHPFVWNRELEPFPLALPAGATETFVRGFNDYGDAVGQSDGHAIAWRLRCH